jgi:hypothetical protein
MVPAASSSNWLKSRLFSGSELTSWLESCSPPEVAGCALWASEGVKGSVTTATVNGLATDSARLSVKVDPPGAIVTGWIYATMRRPLSTVR